MDIIATIQQLQEENARLKAENERLSKPRRSDAGKRRGPSKWRRMLYKAWQEIEPLRRPSASEVMQKILINKSWAFYDTSADAWCIFEGLGQDQQRAAYSLIRAINRGDKAAVHFRVMLAREFEGPAE